MNPNTEADERAQALARLELELIPIRPPAPGRCRPAPITPERAAHNRAVLEAAIRRPTRREAAA